ncbi:DUF2066 domain-containing protein [Vibrio sp. TRT 21S02]|uniref:DUF2066 domain-containing protein n=1 Tax=Vibrio sp. TRT 21S02 TaxID=3418507 RepID=UPI003CEF7EE2
MRNLALMILGLVGLPAYALTNVDLYRAEIVLDQTEENADSEARVQGMTEVLVRASGDQTVANNPVVKKALKQSSQYLAQLSYGQLQGEQTMRMSFSAPHIRSLLTQAQLPFWPSARANILVWLVEETSQDRNIVWEHANSKVLNDIMSQAKQRGLPMTVPVGDFDDITGIAVSDLWGGFAQAVGQASQRYPVDAVLVIRAQGDNVRWTLYDQKPATIGITRQAPLSGSNSGSSASEKMVNQISDYYAKRAAVVVASESSEAIKVRFIELGDAVDFFTLENKLKKLSSVASLDILKIQGHEVTFNVHLLASKTQFEQEVARMGQVTPLEPIVETPTQPELPVSEPVIDGNTTEGVQQGDDVRQQEVSIAPLLPAETILMYKWQHIERREAVPEQEQTVSDETPVSEQISQ